MHRALMPAVSALAQKHVCGGIVAQRGQRVRGGARQGIRLRSL
jgi:hypothetical protein